MRQEGNNNSPDTHGIRKESMERTVIGPLSEITRELASSLSILPPSFSRARKKETDTQDNQDGTNGKQDQGSFSFKTHSGTEVTVQSVGQFLSTTPEERKWTVEGMIPESGLAVLGGQFKQGKSTLAMHLCRKIAAGEPFLERTTQSIPTVYINYEMPDDYLYSLLAGAGGVPKDFFILSYPETRLNVETVDALIQAVKSKGFPRALVVIDSFRGAFKLQGDQENQSGVAGVLLRELQGIAVKTGCLIMVIHHRNKNSEQSGANSLAGTSDWGAAPDVILLWNRPDISKPGTLTIEGRMAPIEPLTVRVTPEECTYVGQAGEGVNTSEEDRILKALGSKRVDGNELVAATGIPYSTLMKRLTKLRQEGKVDFEIGQGTGTPKLWFRKAMSDSAKAST